MSGAVHLNPLAAAAGKSPPGLSRQERFSSYDGTAMTAVLGVFVGIAFILWSIRVYAKIFIIRRAGWDDGKFLAEHVEFNSKEAAY